MSAASGRPAVIAFEGAVLGYRSKVVLREVNLRVGAGEFLGIVGPNGSGKTTLLKAILGSVPPLRGRVVKRAPDGSGRPVGTAYVPQVETIDLLYPLTAFEVALLGTFGRVGLLRVPGRSERDLARRCLAQVGLAGMERRLFRSMSGGQRQRTLLARALASGSDLLLLDEPTAGMDLAAEKGVMDLIAHLHRDEGRTVLLVTHQLNLVANRARRIAILQDGEITLGDAAAILDARTLTSVYGMEVKVVQVNGRRVVIPG